MRISRAWRIGIATTGVALVLVVLSARQVLDRAEPVALSWVTLASALVALLLGLVVLLDGHGTHE